jgi:hypothetical protein
VIHIFTALLSNFNFNTISAYISKLHNQAHSLDRVWWLEKLVLERCLQIFDYTTRYALCHRIWQEDNLYYIATL